MNRTFLPFLLLACLVPVPTAVLANSAGPPDGRTGAPGESSCQACHGTATGDGALTLIGVPEMYQLGGSYTLTVELADNGQQRWGFELTSIDGNGDAAGSLSVTDATNTQLSNNPGANRDYLKQTLAGTYAGTQNGPVSWSFDWTAPVSDLGDVFFYLAGNGANGDFSTGGDFIYFASETSNAPVAPTATPTGIPPTATPTPQGTATPDPCINLGVTLEMPDIFFEAGDPVYLRATVTNQSSMTITGFPLFVLLDVFGEYWAAPSWKPVVEGLDYYSLDFPPGETIVDPISEFAWPEGAGSGQGIIFWGAVTNPGITDICGQYDNWQFGWG